MSARHPTPDTRYPTRWLHRYAVLLVVATFVLVASGGNVTSRDAGLAVPDGFTVYGYFLWTFPMELWRGNIFHEHIHRLKGSAIGLMTIVLAAWMWRACGRDWRRGLGLVALALVIVQGVMGGLRVEFARFLPAMELPFRVAHAVTGQLFLCLTVLVAVTTSRVWHDRVIAGEGRDRQSAGAAARTTCFALIAVLLLQLVLGAAMRHTRSGLAIPDFPSSYGSIVPPLTDAGIAAAMDEHVGYDQMHAYYTPMQVMLAFGHRAWAAAVVIAAAMVLSRVGPVAREDAVVRAPLLLLTLLLIVQIGLGAATIWTKLHPDVATAHQAIGAAILAAATWLMLRVHLARLRREAPSAIATGAMGVPA